MRAYTATRPRGLAPWRPQARTMALVDEVKAVLDEYEAHLPMTARQVFYRLVGAHSYDKTEAGYERLLNVLNRGRRAGFFAFDAIRDDGTTVATPGGFDGPPHFWRAVRTTAAAYTRDRLAGQAAAVEVWVEAAGMVPQVARVAHRYGVPVSSSGGFDSTTAKWEAASRFVAQGRPTIVLHVGDHDASGCAVFDSAADDLARFVADLGHPGIVSFVRVAVTPDQIEAYNLPGAPPKTTDRRGGWEGATVQAEALAPDQLAGEVREAIESVLDLDVIDEVMMVEAAERDALVLAAALAEERS